MEFIQNKVVQGILTLILIVVLVMVVVTIKNVADEVSQTKECQASVKAHAEIIKLGVPARENEIRCPAEELTIKEKNAKKELAEAMRRCWENYGEGQLELFNGEGTFCTVCSIITAKEPTVVENLDMYLLTQYAPGTDQKYMEYFSGVASENAQVLDAYKESLERGVNVPDFTISEQNPYGVIFVQSKGFDNLDRFKNHAKNIFAGGGVMTAGVIIFKGSTALSAIPVVGVAAAGIGKTVGALTFTAGIVGTVIAEYFVELDFQTYSEVLLRPYTEKTLNETIGCTYIPVKVIEE